MTAAGKTFGVVGALAAFPRRVASLEVERQRGQLRRGVTRRTSHIVFGRRAIETTDDSRVASRVAAERAAGRVLMSENGFLRLLGLVTAPDGSALSAQSVIDQSGLSRDAFHLLSLFDAFEHDAEPFSFRDLILARKYSGLIASGASWGDIARSIHRTGPATSLTALSLHFNGGDAIYARLGEGLSELDGQRLLPLAPAADDDLEDVFALAESEEACGRFEPAARHYARCLAIDPDDQVAAFNGANCLRALGRDDEAAISYLRALKIDPSFVEAWFNSAALYKARGDVAAARRHLREAIARDDEYADAVYNLAALEYDAGDLSEARRWWLRYLELDTTSEWAEKAARGVKYVDLHLGRRTAG